MTYLTAKEFEDLGFESVSDFDRLEKRAAQIIDGYISHFYERVNFDADVSIRKNAVKLAVAYQVDYFARSGVLTNEDKQSIASVSIGRTSISYAGKTDVVAHIITADSRQALSGLGFVYRGICDDR